MHLFVDKDGKVSWEEFKKGHFTDDGKDEDSKEQMKEDEEKFKVADEDGDGKLDLEEYLAFYHPGVSKVHDCTQRSENACVDLIWLSRTSNYTYRSPTLLLEINFR